MAGKVYVLTYLWHTNVLCVYYANSLAFYSAIKTNCRSGYCSSRIDHMLDLGAKLERFLISNCGTYLNKVYVPIMWTL